MSKSIEFKALNGRVFDSRVTSANVMNRERWLGFFFGPAIIYISYYVLASSYLNQFYVDVIKLGGIGGGVFLVLLPVLSKVFDAVTNLIMGQIIERTRSRQGKVRPWILVAAPLLCIAGVLLYVIPQAGTMVQVIWVAVSYNLYFAFAFTVYNMSQSLVVPLSTRNTKQRDGLALFLNMANSMLPGAVVYMVFPMAVLPWLGVNPERWALIMSIISIIAVPGILLQYYFIKERVTEGGQGEKVQSISILTTDKNLFCRQILVNVFLDIHSVSIPAEPVHQYGAFLFKLGIGYIQ